MEKQVSIVVPVYNVEKYLVFCTGTLVNQTYNNIEIILIDDGSTDSSGELCDTIAEADPRIIVIHKENGGLSDARNKGIEIAKGDYILFVDSDDYLGLEAVDYMVNAACQYNADIVCIQNVRCNRNDMNEDIIVDENESTVSLFTGIEKMSEYLIGKRINTTAWAKLYKRELFEGIRFPKGRLHEDVFTTYLLVDKANIVFTSNYIGYFYRINNDSITGKTFTPKRLDAIEGKIQQAEFIEKAYPTLTKKANAGIIYACNENLMLMAKANYNNQTILFYLQQLYRNYWKDYFKSKVSLMGKCMAMLAAVNTKVVFFILKKALKWKR